MKPRELDADVLESLDCRHYTPGSPGFEELAAQCKDIALIHKGSQLHGVYIGGEIDRSSAKRRNESIHEGRG